MTPDTNLSKIKNKTNKIKLQTPNINNSQNKMKQIKQIKLKITSQPTQLTYNFLDYQQRYSSPIIIQHRALALNIYRFQNTKSQLRIR